MRKEEAVDEYAFAGKVDERKKSCGRAVGVDIAVGEQQRTHTAWIFAKEDLGGKAPAVVGHKIDRIDFQSIEKSSEHRGLRVGRDDLSFMRLRQAKAHKVGCDASAIGIKTFECPAPLIAVERVTVNEKRRGPVTGFYIGDASHREISKAARASVPVFVEGWRLRREQVRNGDHSGNGGGGVF